jgi:hypothetical protein
MCQHQIVIYKEDFTNNHLGCQIYLLPFNHLTSKSDWCSRAKYENKDNAAAAEQSSPR